jgi:cyanophycin synthetase
MKKIKSFNRIKSLFSKKVIAEILKKEIKVEQVENTNIYTFNKIFSVGNYTSLTPYNYGLILSNKYYALQILKEGKISIPKGKLFNMFDKNEALSYAKKIKFPIMLRLENAQLPIKALKVGFCSDFLPAFENLSKYQENILVEKYFKGKNIKILIVKNGYYNILINNAPVIVGDGRSNISELISKENLRRINLDKIIYPIKVNNEEFKLKEILKKGQKIILSNSIDLPEGGLIEEITLGSHESLIKLAKKILNLFPKLFYLSINLIVKDCQKRIRKDNYVITELRLTPGSNLQYPLFNGKKTENFEKIIADLLCN